MLNILAVNDTVAGEIVVKYSLEVEPAKSFSNFFMKIVKYHQVQVLRPQTFTINTSRINFCVINMAKSKMISHSKSS